MGKLKVGDRVRFTQHAYDNGLVQRGTRRPTTGVVTRVDGWGWTVYVRKDGQKTTSGYHPNFWEPDDTRPAREDG